MAARIEVDRDRCTGIGMCESIDPDVFEVADDGDLIILRAEITDEELAHEATRACPAMALSIVQA